MSDDKNKLINAQEGKTKALRQWRFKDSNEIDVDLIISYIHEAIKNQGNPSNEKSIEKTKLTIPQELADVLKDDEALFLKFDKFSFYKKKGICGTCK